jgi:hypothetical protein
MSLSAARAQTAAAEHALARALLEVGERHRDEHDVFHLTRTLGQLSESHATELGGSADNGRPPDTGSLLGDLRALYLLAEDASICWTILGQGAQAQRDSELLATVTRCHTETLRIVKWITTRIKTTAPQTLSG